jgi:hypothetical protein
VPRLEEITPDDLLLIAREVDAVGEQGAGADQQDVTGRACPVLGDQAASGPFTWSMVSTPWLPQRTHCWKDGSAIVSRRFVTRPRQAGGEQDTAGVLESELDSGGDDLASVKPTVARWSRPIFGLSA